MGRAVGTYVAALALTAAFFLVFPGVDLWASGLFYRPDAGFFLAQWGPVRAIYAGVFYLTDAIVVGVIALYLASLLRGRPVARIDGRAAAFLLLALGLGPGLLVNTVLKDHWGRARPSQVTEFGGSKPFTPAPLPAANCRRNCSFPAGHPAIGFYLVSFAFLVRDRRRRRAAEAAAIAAGAVIGLARLVQGGHFLSDVVFSGLLVSGVSWLLYRVLLGEGRLARRLGAIGPPRRWALPALALLLVVLLSIAFVDRPVARFFHDSNPTLRAVFQFITQFGLSKGYLAISATLFAAFGLAAYAARDQRLAALMAFWARRALFVFVAVAGAGLVADIIKLIFGRARPKLLFAQGFYGFTWGADQADYWSFPSGHTTTVAALAVALYLLWPRGLALYLVVAVLVAASRIIITAHYLSDVLMGAAIGAAVAWASWRGFARAGLGLSRPDRQPAPERYPSKPSSQ
jgi:lipid A 4'-phosphatase